MVNAGRRSKCCFTCRERRVKCDLQKPYCRRCKQAGRPCPGYPDAWDVMLRVQNKYAENRVQARIDRVMSQREEQVDRRSPSIPRSVYITAEVQPGSVSEMLQAVALASSARQLRQSKLMVRARWHYSKAITALNVALNDPVLTADDSILLTLFLLSLYESIIPEYFTSILKDAEFQCHIHVRGVLALLRWRAERGYGSELDKSVRIFFCHIFLISIFVRNSDDKWSAFEAFTTPWVKEPLLEPVLGRVVDFERRSRAQITFKGSHPARMDVIRFIREGIGISEDLEAAASSVRSSLKPDQPLPQQPMTFNNMFEVSTKPTEAIVRSLYQAVRYHVVELLLEFLPIFEEEGDGTSHKQHFLFDPSARFTILEQICDDLGTVLQLDSKHDIEEDRIGIAYRAYGVFWPLILLLFSSSAGQEKRVWAQEKLRLIGDKAGLGLATCAAESIDVLRLS